MKTQVNCKSDLISRAMVQDVGGSEEVFIDVKSMAFVRGLNVLVDLTQAHQSYSATTLTQGWSARAIRDALGPMRFLNWFENWSCGSTSVELGIRVGWLFLFLYYLVLGHLNRHDFLLHFLINGFTLVFFLKFFYHTNLYIIKNIKQNKFKNHFPN